MPNPQTPIATPGADTSVYVQTPADLLAASPNTGNSAWLVAAVDAIDPHVFEQGHDGAYTRALETLAYQQRAEILALRSARVAT